MKLVVLDPGLDSTAGHHYHLDLVLKEQGEARGMDVRLYGYKGMDPAVAEQFDARLVFDMHCYGQVSAVPELMLIHNRSDSNYTFHRNLCESVGQDFDADDILVMHTVLGNQLVGLYLWYRDLPQPRPRLCLILRFPPGFHLTVENHDSAAALDRQALALWRQFPADRVRIACDNQGLGRLYGGLTGLDIPDLPIPIRYPAAKQRGTSRRDPRPHFVYLGEGRWEKGIHLLVEALRALPDLRESVRFTVQCSRPEMLADTLPEWESDLPDVDFLARNLTEADYLSLLADADAVMVPYHPAIYDVRTSHVFLEAVGADKPVLITAGTWMDMELDRLGHTGVRAHDFSVTGIGAALEDMARDWRALAAQAPDAGERCRARHNPDFFFESLLNLFPGTSAQLDFAKIR
jgi:glycosyltransferase involved in cell wall biosynthesis